MKKGDFARTPAGALGLVYKIHDDWVTMYTAEGEVILPVGQVLPSSSNPPARVEVIHDRDSDGGCDVAVYIDGKEVEFTFFDIDPGRGHIRSEWDEETTSSIAGASPDVAVIVKALRDDAAENNNHITD
jgi:hypothetical protein